MYLYGDGAGVLRDLGKENRSGAEVQPGEELAHRDTRRLEEPKESRRGERNMEEPRESRRGERNMEEPKESRRGERSMEEPREIGRAKGI